jgi:hypothetical protein
MSMPLKLAEDKPFGRITSKALFGGTLVGDNLVRFIYVDEAGTSAKEPVSVVVGIVIHGDKQWKSTTSSVAEVLEVVPTCYKPGFIFHAKTIWGSDKYRLNWSQNDRLTLLHSMMSLPRLLKLPIAVGVVRRNSYCPPNLPMSLSRHEMQHILAFWLCLTQADNFLREYVQHDEIATVVAEDVPKIHKYLKQTLKFPARLFPKDQQKFTQIKTSYGVKTQLQEYRISRIIDTIHFAEKEQAPLLQVADACAYGFRRYFAELSLGEDFMYSILGHHHSRDEWATDLCALLFRFGSDV